MRFSRCTRRLIAAAGTRDASENGVVAADFHRYILYPAFVDIATSPVFVADLA